MGNIEASATPPPETPLSQRLRFRADWGGANLIRVCGWLAHWVWKQTPDHRLSVIHTGRGMGDNLRALATGEVDVAVVTPSSFVRLAREGRGPFHGSAMPDLRAIASLPHRDAMLLTSRAELGITSLDALAAYEGPLRLSVGANDADGFMGLGAAIVLEAAGLTYEKIIERGGTVRYHEDPFGCVDDLREGRADAIVAEAIMSPSWVSLGEQIAVSYGGLSADQQNVIEQHWGLSTRTIPSGYLPGMDTSVATLDYSDFLITTTSALPDHVAAMLTEAVLTDSATLERQYRHLPADRSPLSYPIINDAAADTPIPLHSAAATVFKEASCRFC